jgi:hypothetical protein
MRLVNGSFNKDQLVIAFTSLTTAILKSELSEKEKRMTVRGRNSCSCGDCTVRPVVKFWPKPRVQTLRAMKMFTDMKEEEIRKLAAAYDEDAFGQGRRQYRGTGECRGCNVCHHLCTE